MWRWNQQRGRKRFPLSHKKRKNERDCKGNESILEFRMKLLQSQEKKLHEERKKRGGKSLETRDNREDLKRKKLQKFS